MGNAKSIGISKRVVYVEPDRNLNFGMRTDLFNHIQQKARPVFKAAAISAFPFPRRQQLIDEIAVAGAHVYRVKPRLLRKLCREQIIVLQA